MITNSEKLARDTMASGDRVLAENYFQHAEHYNRIIMAYRDQQLGNAHEGSSGRNRSDGSDANEDFGEDENESAGTEASANGHAGDQPNMAGGDDQPTGNSEREGRRNPRQRRGRPNRNGNARNGSGNANANAGASAEADDGQGGKSPERFADSNDQPDFLRRSVRSRRRSDTDKADAEGASEAQATADE